MAGFIGNTPTSTNISGTDISDGSITNADIADLAASKLTGTITPSADTVTSSQIADDAINSEHYVDGSIDLAHLSADCVDGTKIADDSINSEHIVDGSVDDAHLATGISSSKLTGALPAISGASLTNLPSDITKSTSEPTATTNPSGGVGTLYLRTTTGEMYCCTDATTNANLWVNIGDGTGGQPDISTATGGTITTSGDYKFHAFTSSGTFTVGSTNNSNYDILAIAGGGAAGWSESGGGGAGGLIYQSGRSLSISTAYTVTIGAGGTKDSSSNSGVVGNDTTFGSVFTAKGGGAGADYDYNPAGTTGGSGGGGGHSASPYTGYAATQPTQSGDSGTYGFGNAGGEAYNGGSNDGGSGGGGGAGGAAPHTGATNGATNNNSPGGGYGGVGKEISLFSAWGTASDNTGTSGGWFAGGGAGGKYNATNNGLGGAGGGGNGSHNGTTPGSGVVNTGSGGGGGTAGNSGSGGSGIVLIRYKFQ